MSSAAVVDERTDARRRSNVERNNLSSYIDPDEPRPAPYYYDTSCVVRARARLRAIGRVR